MPRVLVVSDTHWPADGSFQQWSVFARWLDTAPVDLVVHAGDATVDGARQPEQLPGAAAALADLPVRWAAVPGNHDVGDSSGSGDPPVTGERRQPWLDAFGDDHWMVPLGSWAVVGLDSQLLGSGLAAEEDQWAWLAGAAGGLPPDTQVAVVTHKPVHAPTGERQAKPNRFVPADTLQRLEESLAGRPLRLVLTGHVHQARELADGPTRHVWVPSAWAFLPEAIQATVGEKRCGAVLADLGDDGSLDVGRLEPDGLAQHVAGETVANPYARG